jgi:hypothetical protein
LHKVNRFPGKLMAIFYEIILRAESPAENNLLHVIVLQCLHSLNLRGVVRGYGSVTTL